MPLFTYMCKACEHETETLERPGVSVQPACEQCGSSQLDRLPASFGVGESRSSDAVPACATGSCPAGRCPGGTCPF
ncbi:MAG TPA: zinc ribbon domain-containing protein [Candidatus Hydrogenedentes bacterium]|nr:zinc ribbon domain-containing protein [Candidatus Hydrogenedentota bacterium]